MRDQKNEAARFQKKTRGWFSKKKKEKKCTDATTSRSETNHLCLRCTASHSIIVTFGFVDHCWIIIYSLLLTGSFKTSLSNRTPVSTCGMDITNIVSPKSKTCCNDENVPLLHLLDGRRKDQGVNPKRELVVDYGYHLILHYSAIYLL